MPVVLMMSVSSSCRCIRVSTGSGLFTLSHGPPTRKPVAASVADAVARELLENEPVVGLVGVEGANQVIAIGIGVGPLDVRLEAVSLGEPHDVEPVPGPAFAVMRARQHAIDEPIPGERIGVGGELGDLIRRWRQPEHVEIEPANERAPIGGRRRRESCRVQLRCE